MVSGLILIAAGAYAFIIWRDKHRYHAIKRERAAALEVYRMVLKNVDGDLLLKEYNRALRYTIRKYHLGDDGRIEYVGSEKWYLAELITEAVNQKRISEGTIKIAQSNAELGESKQIIIQEGLTA